MGGLGCPLLQPITTTARDLAAKGYKIVLGCYFNGQAYLQQIQANHKDTIVVVGHSMGAWAVSWMADRVNNSTHHVTWIGLDPLYTGAVTHNAAVLDIWEGGWPMGGPAKNTWTPGHYGPELISHIFFPWDPVVRSYVLKHAP